MTEDREPVSAGEEPRAHGRHRSDSDDVAAEVAQQASPKRSGRTRSHLLVAVLCAALGFAIVVQVRQTHSDDFSTLRQDDLVELLDEITQRNEQLEEEQAQLILDRNDLASGVDAQTVAERNAEAQAVLAGTVPVHGPGIALEVREVESSLEARIWVNLVEELRNAGAEAIAVNDIRLGASSAFVDTGFGVELDGELLTSPILVLAIGDPQTLEVALEIPGGALATLRTAQAVPTTTRVDDLIINAVRELDEPRVAEPTTEPTAG